MDFTIIIKPGLIGEKTDTVTEKNVAAFWGSGYLSVYSTPAMIALMEWAALSTVENLLPSGWSTVGTELNIKHVSATPLGMEIKARAELVNIDGRALSYKIEAFDEVGKIGEGTHKRFIVENEKFMNKTNSKSIV